MKKLNLKELQKSKYDKITNYFCKENIRFFNSDISKIQAYENDYYILFLDNIRFESKEFVDNREYNIKRFDKKNNIIERIFHTTSEKDAVIKFKELIKGSDMSED